MSRHAVPGDGREATLNSVRSLSILSESSRKQPFEFRTAG